MRKEKSILNISSTSKDGIQVGTGQSFYVYEIIFRDAPDIRPFFIFSIRSDTEFDLPYIRPDTGY
jgi:hypothetical protein